MWSSVRLSWYPMWMWWLPWLWCVYCCLCCVCKLRECELWGCEGDDNAGVGDGWGVVNMWVIHVVQVLCLAHLTCYRWVWCVGWEDLVEYVFGSGRHGGGMSRWEDWVWALPIVGEQGECWACICVGVQQLQNKHQQTISGEATGWTAEAAGWTAEASVSQIA